MIDIARRRILIDGEPRLVIAGEVHYFRTPRELWERRLDQLMDVGCTAVASYIPWIVHELPDGTLDLDGATRADRDLGAFIDLCAARGLWFIARPGPFQMAELKNEGLPHRIHREHPEIVPAGWDGTPAPTSSVDYLAPAFLAEVERWYAAVMPVLAARLITRGGPVIAVQLDNEIGMLAWVSNSPDLTDHLLTDLRGWIRAHREDAARTYPALEEDEHAWALSVRSPEEAWAGALRHDLTQFMRDRFARYVDELAASAARHGVEGVPLLINIHGTSGGSAESFPIGISQLVETYSGRAGRLSGSDHYVGDMTLDTTPDLYVLNALQQAVHDDDQPLTSLEFEAGSGDYGDGLERMSEPSTADLKSRLFAAQGNRLLNYYLLAGGINPPLDEPVGDGNDRISSTGRRHGFAAPIGPEGQESPTFAPLRAGVHQLLLHERHLASGVEELDDLSLAFVLDSYATEYAHPGSAVMTEIVEDLRAHRGAGQRKALARSALLRGHRFDAVDVRSMRPRPDGSPRRVLMLASSAHLDPAVQQNLVDHLRGGGSLLMLGLLPEKDLEGAPCRILADALGAQAGPLVRDSPHFFPSVSCVTAPEALGETRVSWLQELRAEGASTVLEALDGTVCGIEAAVGAGRAVLLAAGLPSHPGLFGHLLDRLGARRGLELGSSVPGVFATSTRDPEGGRVLHVLNVTGHRPEVRIVLDGEEVLLRPAPHTGYLLARGLAMGGVPVLEANAEVIEASDGILAFGAPAADALRVVLGTTAAVRAEGGDARVTAHGGRTVVTSAGPVRLLVERTR
ncbi:beta-galactosidase [Brachybacterium sp. AOP43-C2-M15]|uniref:beta-galactosidase n=1 Tax=Brachybacterium sp. AOP43-C2-M15 TaxID=3457661 RepID=UPI0040348AA8